MLFEAAFRDGGECSEVSLGQCGEGVHRNQVGLAHVAMIADSFETVQSMYKKLKDNGVQGIRTADHGVTKSVYFKDPEGNELEIYCEVPETRWQEVDTIIKSEPLDLEDGVF